MTIQFSSYYLTCILLVSWSLQSILAQLAKLFIYGGLNVVCLSVCLCVCLDFNPKGSTNRSQCTKYTDRLLVILHAHT